MTKRKTETYRRLTHNKNGCGAKNPNIEANF
jgi:hypothetical protein